MQQHHIKVIEMFETYSVWSYVSVLVFCLSTGLETLGVIKFDKDPPGADDDRISAEIFLKEA